MNPPELTTPRLILKSITPAVIHELFNTKTEEEIKQFFGCHDTHYEHLRQVHLQGVEMYRLSHHHFLIIEKETNVPMGECGFHTWNTKHRRAELFYLLYKDEYKQKGFVKEALGPVLAFGFTQMGLHRVAAFITDENMPSKKLLLRYGFTKEGTMREDYNVEGVNEDSDCYSLLKWEWEKNNQFELSSAEEKQ